MSQWVSRAEAAKALGISRQALEKLIREGKIKEKPNPNGRRPKTVIDLDTARRDYARNTDPAKRKAAQQAARAGQAAGSPQAPNTSSKPAAPRRPYGRAGADTGPGGIDYNTARTAKTAYQAELTKLALAREKGRMVPRAEVEAAAVAMARKLRDRLLAFPARLAPYVDRAALPEIEAEIRQLVEELARDAQSLGAGQTQ